MTTAASRRKVAVEPTAELDIRAALAQLQQAGHGDERELIETMEHAVAAAYARLWPEAPSVTARIDLVGGSFRLVRTAAGGEEEPVLERPADFERQAAHAAKSAVAGWMRDAERDRIIRAASARKGELVDTVVERSDGAAWLLRADGFAAMLPAEEQIPGEVLERNRHLKVIVLEVRRRGREAVAVVSRSHPALLRRLLEQEVPEVGSGEVVIRAIAREPGRRSKVAVHAPDGGVDPEGACIGAHGVRIKAVVSELGEEQVHIVGWSSDSATYVAGALAPAQTLAVELDSETRTARVTVPTSQLSLAIGRSGENARLAARLTGWRIDIHGEDAP
ncbi:MAG TPA: transcription termination/antitermination protein NusA [Candidatus Dormibacteraeota bacterium]|nr:transcription termination/antitermination protein NusA [Candidatus Dormibacteraeota bacterium]